MAALAPLEELLQDNERCLFAIEADVSTAAGREALVSEAGMGLGLTLSLTVTPSHARRAAGPLRAREGRLRGAAAVRPYGVAEVGRPARRW